MSAGGAQVMAIPRRLASSTKELATFDGALGVPDGVIASLAGDQSLLPSWLVARTWNR